MANKINKNIFESSSKTSQPKTPEVKKAKKQDNNDAVSHDNDGVSSIVFNEIMDLVDAIKAGKLESRANLRDIDGAEKELLEGINDMLDAVNRPVKVVNDFMDKVARGDNLQLITEEYKGDFNITKNNMNNCVNVIHSILDETSRLTQAACEGRLNVRCDDAQLYNNLQKSISMADSYLSKYYGNIAYQNGTLVDKNGKGIAGDTQMVDALTAAAGGVATIFAKSGDDFVRIATNVINDKGERAVGTMLGKSSLAYSNVSQGKNYSGPATILNKPYLTAYNPLFDQYKQVIGILFVGLPQIQGSWNQLVTGINETLDAVVGPLTMAAECVERIGKGDIPDKITESYNGDFNELKINLNACIDGLGGLVECSNVLKRMAVNDNTKQVEGQYQGIFAETAQAINDVRSRLLVITDTLNNVASGDFKKLKEYKEIGGRSKEDKIIPAFITMMENILKLVGDAGMMADAAVEGRLDVRIDATQHQGEYRIVADGINNTLDAISGPVKVVNGFMDKVARGENLQLITEEYKGDFNIIKNNMNNCVNVIHSILDETSRLTQAACEGRLDVRCDDAQLYNNLQNSISMADSYLSKYYGNIAYQNGALVDKNGKGIAGDMQMVDALTAAAGGVATIFAKSGDDFVRIATNIINDKGERAVGTMLGKSSLAYSSVSQGKNYSGPATILNKPYLTAYNPLFDQYKQVIGILFVGLPQLQGSWNQLVTGINETLDAVVGPLNMAAEYVERIGKGDIPPKITESYNGDFNELKINLNACIDGLGGLVECTAVLTKMEINDYTDKVKGQYQGIFAETAQGVNTARHRLIKAVKVNTNISNGDFAEDLEYFKKVGRLSDQDQLIPSYTKSMENIDRLVNDARMMAEAAVEGRLDVRVDITRHQGEYRKVVEGINNTMDAIIGPLNMAADYIERIAKGDTPPQITDEYNGDYNAIKNNLNTCIESIGILVEEVGVAINAGVEGKLDQRANANRGQGVYHKILAGVNATMDALIAPINEAILVINEMSEGNLSIKMQGNYQGDNAKLKEHMNLLTDRLSAVVGEVSETLGQLSNGNLDINQDRDFMGDFAGISSALRLIIESLNDVMGDINHAAEEVAGGSQQVSDSSQALAQGASEQASAIEQLTAAITEIASKTKQNATYANQANELALNARDNAAQGNEQMKEMLDAMEGINDSSANISKIIKVIDEIAFQTNILALNAAVEAARAGQHGKGFAVVAEEVRNLAARSASAAKETTDLIEGSIRKVQSGTKIANETAQALNKIVDGVSKAAELVGDIAIASNEQATGIAQVDQGIGQVSQVVQTNSATAQQSAAASEELSGQAGMLKERVSMFRLKGSSPISRGYDSKAAQLGRSRQAAPSINRGAREAAATSTRARIALDKGDFGKY